jgi:hypothetical protein
MRSCHAPRYAVRLAVMIFAPTVAGCGVVESEPVGFVARGTVWADPTGPTPSQGRPLAGAVVNLVALPGIVSRGGTVARTTSDASGRFELHADRCAAILDAQVEAYHVDWVEGWEGLCMSDRVDGVIIHMQLDDEPESTLDFVAQPSATSQQCLNRPPGTVCAGYSDGYAWLVTTSTIRGSRSGGRYQGQPVEVAIGDQSEFHHVLGTELVAEVSLTGPQ